MLTVIISKDVTQNPMHCVTISYGKKGPGLQGHRNAATAYNNVADFIFKRQELT